MAITPYFKDGKKLFEVYLQGKDPTGKRIQLRRKGITSERKAQQIEFELKTEIEGISSGKPIWTWERWHEECVRRMRLELKQSSIFKYDGDLKGKLPHDWSERKVEDFAKQDVYDLLHENERCVTLHQKKNTLKAVNRIFELALEEGIIPRNPAKGLKVQIPSEDPTVLSPREVEILLTEGRLAGHFFYPHWTSAVMTGMRNGELYSLRISDIDLDAGFIYLKKQFTSKDGLHELKTKYSRTIPIADQLRPFLQELIAQGGYTEELWEWEDDKKISKRKIVFTDLLLPRSGHWKAGNQAQQLSEFCKSIGIPSVVFHELRATFITNMLANGVPTSVVMKIVGHLRLATLNIYLALAGVEVKGATNKLGYKVPERSIYDDSKIIDFMSYRN